MNRLFVYGTLQPGQPNAHLLESIGGTFEKATVRGHLHAEGWGATMGYPAIKLDPAGPQIDGYLFTSPALETHWPELDDFEGDAYQRIETRVRLADGDTKAAYVYALRE